MDIWQNANDIDLDLFTMNEFGEGQKYPTPKRRVKNKVQEVKESSKSIYDFDDFPGLNDEEKKKVAERELISAVGRGYVMKKYKNVNKSDGVIPQLVLDQTTRDIREVCPDGYSNELIESAFKNHSESTDKSLKPLEGFRFSPSSDVKNGAIPKKVGISSSTTNDLPADFIEYDTTIKLNDKREFPGL